jgi:DNA-binding response OmpR family regulator
MKTIAIADDDPDMVRLLRQILADHHEVASYSTGAQLLREIVVEPPACVVLDIDLGDMNGIAVLRALRADARTKAIPVIAVTTHNYETERAKYLNEGFDDYIAKPFDADVLLATVATALAGECQPFIDDEADEVEVVAAEGSAE